MLAETPSSANGIPVANTRILSGTATSKEAAVSSFAGNPQEGDTASNPRVSLPHLRAILEHGGGMPAADVVDVCHLCVREAEEASRVLGQMQGQRNEQRAEKATAAAPVDTVGAQDEPATELKLDENEGTAREGAEATAATIPDGVQAETNDNDCHAMTGEGREDRYDANRETPGGTAGEDNITAENIPQKQRQPALTFSFAAVSECRAVREWIRRGAYTLPAFNVTSGRQQD